MRVIFFLSGVPKNSPYYDLAEAAIARARRYIKDAHIVQHTDMETTAILGVDEVVRSDFDCPLILGRMKHLANETEDFLSLDVDLFLRADLEEVFAYPFDVCLVRRYGNANLNGMDCGRYVCSLMVSRSIAFWNDLVTEAEKLPIEDQRWIGPQVAIDAIASKYKILELPEKLYSYHHDIRPDVKAVHLKGARKLILCA